MNIWSDNQFFLTVEFGFSHKMPGWNLKCKISRILIPLLGSNHDIQTTSQLLILWSYFKRFFPRIYCPVLISRVHFVDVGSSPERNQSAFEPDLFVCQITKIFKWEGIAHKFEIRFGFVQKQPLKFIAFCLTHSRLQERLPSNKEQNKKWKNKLDKFRNYINTLASDTFLMSCR